MFLGSRIFGVWGFRVLRVQDFRAWGGLGRLGSRVFRKDLKSFRV